MENTNSTILIVDDELDILEFLSYNLKKEEFNVHTAQNGKDAISIAQKIKPNLILLDVMMPEMDGIETCEEIRKHDSLSTTVIAFLTARGEDYSQIAGFEAGADDYITKPIKPKVLVSRIKALLKRQPTVEVNKKVTGKDQILKVGELTIDREKYIVLKNDQELKLPKKEFELLLLFASKPEKVFTRDEIFSKVWGDNIIVGDRTIDVHVRKLREKIGEDHIATIKGVGYKYIN
jgi:two-component system, OmpR family, alkaline phosphatase synthesis response regulator PhoP